MTIQTVGGRIYEFGLTDRLRIAREQAGLGQREFAAATGISRSSIANYEAGTTTPKRPQLIAWAMATGFSLAWLESGQAGSGGDGNHGTPGQVDIPFGNGLITHLQKRRRVTHFPAYLDAAPQLAA